MGLIFIEKYLKFYNFYLYLSGLLFGSVVLTMLISSLWKSGNPTKKTDVMKNMMLSWFRSCSLAWTVWPILIKILNKNSESIDLKYLYNLLN